MHAISRRSIKCSPLDLLEAVINSSQTDGHQVAKYTRMRTAACLAVDTATNNNSRHYLLVALLPVFQAPRAHTQQPSENQQSVRIVFVHLLPYKSLHNTLTVIASTDGLYILLDEHARMRTLAKVLQHITLLFLLLLLLWLLIMYDDYNALW